MKDKKSDENKKEKKKIDKRWLIIMLLVIIILILGITRCQSEKVNNPRETVIEAPPEEEMTIEEAGTIRIRINTYLTVENGEVSNLNFSNFNSGELMDLEIISNEKTIFRSSKIGEGEIIEKAKVKTGGLEYGENEAIAKICYYKSDGTYEGQTNFEIKILYI